MLGVGVLGATGRMGRLVVAQVLDAPDLELRVAASHAGSGALGVDAGTLAGRGAAGVPVTAIGAALGAVDVVIDFALPAGTLTALPFLGSAALVTGTTGLDAEGLAALERHATRAPVLHAANFSTGVTALIALVEAAARSLPDFDVEVVEAHHRRKVDAPSGTALALASAAAGARGWPLEGVRRDGRSGHTGARSAHEIGLHAVRGGSVTGHHTVWLAGDGERLTLTHEAESREVFASGAVRAARWVARRAPGRYTLRDAIGL